MLMPLSIYSFPPSHICVGYSPVLLTLLSWFFHNYKFSSKIQLCKCGYIRDSYNDIWQKQTFAEEPSSIPAFNDFCHPCSLFRYINPYAAILTSTASILSPDIIFVYIPSVSLIHAVLSYSLKLNIPKIFSPS